MTTCGVYTITNLASWTVYVGASHKIESRWHEHRSTLKHGKHRSANLQADWDRLGSDRFVFTIAVRLPAGSPRCDLIAAERSMIARLIRDGVRLYNANGDFGRAAPRSADIERAEEATMKLRQARQEWPMTLGELARLSGVSVSTIANIEKGRHVPFQRTIKLLSAALDCEPADIDEFADAIRQRSVATPPRRPKPAAEEG